MHRFMLLFIVMVPFFNTLSAQMNDSLAHALADKAEAINAKGSLSFLEEAFEICSNNRCADSTIARLYQRKSVAYLLGYIDDNLAIAYADTATHIYEKVYGICHELTANSRFNIGAFREILGYHTLAIENIENAIACQAVFTPDISEIRRDSMLCNWHYILGRAYSKVSNYTAAQLNQKHALGLSDRAPSFRRRILYSIGNTAQAQNNYSLAKEVFFQLTQNGTDTTKSTALENLGNAYLATDNIIQAEYYLTTTLRIKARIHSINNSKKSIRSLSNSHANLLQLYIQKQDWGLAEEHYQEALRLLLEVDSTGHLPRFAEIYFKKAKVEHGQGRYDSSLSFLDKAMKVVAPQLASATTDEAITIIGPFKRVLEIIGFRARVRASQGLTEAALKDIELLNRLVTQGRRSYQSSLSKYYLLQQVVPVYELGIQINRQQYLQTGEQGYIDQAYALNARNKAILLLESLQSERAMTFADLPESVQAEEQRLRDALSEQESKLYTNYQKGKPIDSLENVVFEHEQTYHQFIQQLEQDYPAYYQLKYSSNTAPTSTEIKQQLATDQVMVEYFVGQDSIYSFLLHQDHFELFAVTKPSGFADSVTLFRELLSNGIEQDCEAQFISLSRYFYQLLLAQPLAQLDASQDRLVIIPDGLLNFLSFEALLYRDVDRLVGAKGFLLEKYAFSYAYSSRLLLEEQYHTRSASKSFVGFGLEYDDYTLNYLKDLEAYKTEDTDTTFQLPCGLTTDTTRYLGKLAYSDDEVRAIAQLTKGDSWLNEEVTKQTFLENAADYELLHLAMHGSYDLEFPMNSSLIFTRSDSSDVFLRAAEIYGLELAGDMVVLSACNTAFGKLQEGEGPMTLARAFHYAGIPSVVASLWSIPDNSTSSIMQLFYEQLNKGLDKDVALQQAKLAYLLDNELSSPATRMPVHWAPTVVIGNVNPVKKVLPWAWVLAGVLLLGGVWWYGRRRVIG